MEMKGKKLSNEEIDIDPKSLALVQTILKQKIPFQAVWAFGSRVNWKANPHSDLDLVVFNLEMKKFAELQETFEESNLPFRVDLVDWGFIPDTFKENIQTKYVVLQEKPELPEWKEVKLGELLQSANTGLDAIKRAPIVNYDSGKKCLRIQDISQGKDFSEWGHTEVDESNYRKFQLRKNDILLARTGATVGVNLIVKNDLPSVFNNGLIRIRANKEIADPLYIYWNLRTENYKNYIESISGGTSTQPNIQINALLNFAIFLPPLPEQKAIASVLSSLDDKIDLLYRQNKTLESMAETLFRKWFVEDAEESWEEKKLTDIADFLNGIACQKYPPKNEIERLPVLKIRELSNGINESSDWASSEVKSDYIVNTGDIIFSWSASLMVKIWDGGKCILNQHLFKVTSENYPKWFFLMWCRYHLKEFISISNSHATTMGHIKRSDLENAFVIIPDRQSLNEMNNSMTPLFERQIRNSTQIRNLENLRNTLLPKLISGEIRVSL